jgi:hypothetical protein
MRKQPKGTFKPSSDLDGPFLTEENIEILKEDVIEIKKKSVFRKLLDKILGNKDARRYYVQKIRNYDIVYNDDGTYKKVYHKDFTQVGKSTVFYGKPKNGM